MFDGDVCHSIWPKRNRNPKLNSGVALRTFEEIQTLESVVRHVGNHNSIPKEGQNDSPISPPVMPLAGGDSYQIDKNLYRTKHPDLGSAPKMEFSKI